MEQVLNSIKVLWVQNTILTNSSWKFSSKLFLFEVMENLTYIDSLFCQTVVATISKYI